jgi:hypothetical protein
MKKNANIRFFPALRNSRYNTHREKDDSCVPFVPTTKNFLTSHYSVWWSDQNHWIGHSIEIIVSSPLSTRTHSTSSKKSTSLMIRSLTFLSQWIVNISNGSPFLKLEERFPHFFSRPTLQRDTLLIPNKSNLQINTELVLAYWAFILEKRKPNSFWKPYIGKNINKKSHFQAKNFLLC